MIKGFFLALSLTGFCLAANAQVTIDRWVIGTCGSSATVGSYTIMHNSGEAVVSSVPFGSSLLTQGFEQADESPKDGLGGAFYHGFTPNGDGKNDFWYIDSAAYYKNTVEIYNRWGNKVWEGHDYDNTTVLWEGTNSKGETLPDATYFFLVRIDQGTGRLAGKNYKGWVELTR